MRLVCDRREKCHSSVGQDGILRRVGNPPGPRLPTGAQLAKLPHKRTSACGRGTSALIEPSRCVVSTEPRTTESGPLGPFFRPAILTPHRVRIRSNARASSRWRTAAAAAPAVIARTGPLCSFAAQCWLALKYDEAVVHTNCETALEFVKAKDRVRAFRRQAVLAVL